MHAALERFTLTLSTARHMSSSYMEVLCRQTEALVLGCMKASQIFQLLAVSY